MRPGGRQLRLPDEDDLDPGQQIKFDGETIPVYTDAGKRVKGMELMQLMMSREYTPTPYIDESKDIKAFVLRPATEEELKTGPSVQTRE